MHVLTIPDTPEADASSMKPGRYLCENNNAAEMMLIHQALRPTVTPFEPCMVSRADNMRILLVGTMGFGDAILITPVLRELKKRNPTAEITISCFESTRQVFFGLTYVDAFLDYPPKLETLQEYGAVLFIENAHEFNMLAKTQHMTDRFAQHLGLGTGEWTDDKKPDFRLSGEERAWAAKSFPPNKGKRRLGIQVQAGVRCRSYPMSQLAGERVTKVNGGEPLRKRSVLGDMLAEGWEIALLGAPGEFRMDSAPDGMLDMTRFGLTFRQTAAFMTTCNAILAPDSSLLHVAGALDIPCVGLYGPFPWKLRTSYYKSVFALHGEGACPMAPCFHTHHNGLPLFPRNGPCDKTGICEELAAIQPERIRAKIEQVAQSPVVVP